MITQLFNILQKPLFVQLTFQFVILLIRHRRHNKISSKEEENIEEPESTNIFSSGIKISQFEEDPFANDFNEDNIINNI